MDKIRRRHRARTVSFTNTGHMPRQGGHTAIWPIDSSRYHLSMLDSSVPCPVALHLTSDLLQMINTEIGKQQDEFCKAHALFDWMEQHVNYDHDKPHNTYRTANEVLLFGKGVCGEMAYLYIAMSRLAGMISKYVEVDKDFYGNDVSHACAVVYPDGREIFVDPAYHQFDVRHRSYKILPDKEMFKHFLDMRMEDPFGIQPAPSQLPGIKKGFLEWLLER